MNGLSFRPIHDGDLPFLEHLYGTTRQLELDQTDWSSEQKSAFIRMQFEAQHRHYREHFSKAQFDLVLSGDRPIGRLYVDRRSDEIRIIDIALLPEFRGRGIGRQLMEDLLEEAKNKGVAVRIHVEQFNPAMRLYQRLGFRKVRDEGVYFLMEWRSS